MRPLPLSQIARLAGGRLHRRRRDASTRSPPTRRTLRAAARCSSRCGRELRRARPRRRTRPSRRRRARWCSRQVDVDDLPQVRRAPTPQHALGDFAAGMQKRPPRAWSSRSPAATARPRQDAAARRSWRAPARTYANPGQPQQRDRPAAGGARCARGRAVRRSTRWAPASRATSPTWPRIAPPRRGAGQQHRAGAHGAHGQPARHRRDQGRDLRRAARRRRRGDQCRRRVRAVLRRARGTRRRCPLRPRERAPTCARARILPAPTARASCCTRRPGEADDRAAAAGPPQRAQRAGRRRAGAGRRRAAGRDRRRPATHAQPVAGPPDRASPAQRRACWSTTATTPIPARVAAAIATLAAGRRRGLAGARRHARTRRRRRSAARRSRRAARKARRHRPPVDAWARSARAASARVRRRRARISTARTRWSTRCARSASRRRGRCACW